MITLTTEQAQQIEEVLEELCGSIDFYNKYGPDWTHKDGTESFNVSVLLDRADDISKAIIALREALDHSGETNEMVVGWDRVKSEAIASDPLYQQGFVDGVEEGRNQLAEQTEQEPVGVVNPNGGINWRVGQEQLPPRTKLYTHPVRTKDLTDEEIMACRSSDPAGGSWLESARAVIQEFRRKNGIV